MATNWYRQIVAKLKLTDVMPELTHDTEVCRLDAERERLANEYLAADGALLRQIERHLKHDGSGRWTRYIENRFMPGGMTQRERMRFATGQHVDVERFDRSVVYNFTHCRACDNPLPKCICRYEEEYQEMQGQAS